MSVPLQRRARRMYDAIGEVLPRLADLHVDLSAEKEAELPTLDDVRVLREQVAQIATTLKDSRT